jgi:gliding motility-associated-like protein
MTSMAHSQCTQGLGAPLINETFGSGTFLYGPPLPVGVTQYTYLASECPDDSQYAIVNYTSGCYGVWPTLTDHTGDPGGYFMIVNAAAAPSTFYTDTINGLCQGTSYQFSSWIVNLGGGTISPNITFTVEKTDGTILGSYNATNIPVANPATWEQYGFYFTTQAGDSTVVIRMRNNAPGGSGNNFAVDDISFTPSGPLTTIKIDGSARDTLNIPCNNNTVLSSTVGSCYANTAYQWQISTDNTTWTNIPGATDSVYATSLTSAGTFLFRLAVGESGNIGSANCRVISNTATIINALYVKPQVKSITANICSGNYLLPSGKIVDSTGIYVDTLYTKAGCDSVFTTVNLSVSAKPKLGNNRSLCIGDTITLNPGLFSQYLWQDNSTGSTYTVTKGGTYWVKVIDTAGCEFSDTVKITSNYCMAIKIPNTFTPNGDGINDTWNIPPLQYFPSCTVFVYTKWGRQVFTSIGYSKAWDGTYNGKGLPVGTYYYVIDLNNNTKPLAGFITLIR